MDQLTGMMNHMKEKLGMQRIQQVKDKNLMNVPLTEEERAIEQNFSQGLGTSPEAKAISQTDLRTVQEVEPVLAGPDHTTTTAKIIAHAEAVAVSDLNFDGKKAEIVKKYALTSAVAALRAIYGGFSPAQMASPEFKAIVAAFSKSVGDSFENFRPQNGQKLIVGSEAYQNALSQASYPATRELANLFAVDGNRQKGTDKVQRMLDALDPKVHVYAVIKKQEIPFPDSLKGSEITPEDWKRFVHLGTRLPNAGWMAGIYARTDHGEDTNKNVDGVQLATTKNNVGDFETMVNNKIEEGKKTNPDDPESVAAAEIAKDFDEIRKNLPQVLEENKKLQRTFDTPIRV